MNFGEAIDNLKKNKTVYRESNPEIKISLNGIKSPSDPEIKKNIKEKIGSVPKSVYPTIEKLFDNYNITRNDIFANDWLIFD